MLNFDKFIGSEIIVNEKSILAETGAEIIERDYLVNDPTIMTLKKEFANLDICIMMPGMFRSMELQPDVLFVWLTKDGMTFKINSITMDN